METPPLLTWVEEDPASPELFERLRALGPARVSVRVGIGMGDGSYVEVPAASIAVQGELQVEPDVDRFGIRGFGSTDGDFAWFARRKGRGRTDYWQGALEQHRDGRPALILYFTAELDGLVIRTAVLEAAGEGASPRHGEPMAEAGP